MVSVLGAVLCFLFVVAQGRDPITKRLDHYSALHEDPDPRVAFDTLKQLDEAVEDLDFERARQVLLTRSNWFFAQRYQLPESFVNSWFMLRSRVNRLAATSKRHEPWAEREIEVGRHQAIRLIAEMMDALEAEGPTEAVIVEDETQDSRVTSAPSARSLSSIRS